MNDKEIKKEALSDKIIELSEQGKCLTDEEMDLLMQDEEARDAYKSFLNFKTAIRQEYRPGFPDVDEEWKRFQHRKQSKSMSRYFIWGAMSGVVAAVLVVLIFFWWNTGFSPKGEILAYQANTNGPQQIMLETNTGEQIVLEPNMPNDALESVGTLLGKADTLELKYKTKNEGKVDMHTLSTPRGHDFKVVLEDGTAVWLNAESRLNYPSRFEGKERKVTLQGEAYFKVAKDADHPFIISMENMQVRVLGTELNVRNYADRDKHVTLIKGSVEVKGELAQYKKLRPGEDAMLMDDGSLTVNEVDVDTYTYWKEGYLYFDNVSFIDVMQEVGRWYNMNVVFNNKNAMELRVRCFFDRRDTIEQAVVLLNRMNRIHVMLLDNTIYVQ